MSAGKGKVRAPRKSQPLKHGQLNAAIRQMQMAQAVATAAARSGAHDLVDASCLADAAAAIVVLVELALDGLDKAGVAP